MTPSSVSTVVSLLQLQHSTKYGGGVELGIDYSRIYVSVLLLLLFEIGFVAESFLAQVLRDKTNIMLSSPSIFDLPFLLICEVVCVNSHGCFISFLSLLQAPSLFSFSR